MQPMHVSGCQASAFYAHQSLLGQPHVKQCTCGTSMQQNKDVSCLCCEVLRHAHRTVYKGLELPHAVL